MPNSKVVYDTPHGHLVWTYDSQFVVRYTCDLVNGEWWVTREQSETAPIADSPLCFKLT